MKNKGDLERECDALKAELDNYNNKVQVLERTVEHLKKTIDEKVFRAVNSFHLQDYETISEQTSDTQTWVKSHFLCNASGTLKSFW